MLINETVLGNHLIWPLPLQRYYEVYHLKPNTTYEFRIWANNLLGAGEMSYTTATTLSQLSDQG